MPPLKGKKKAPPKSKSTPSRTGSKVVARVAVLWEGTLTNPKVDLGPNVSILENPVVVGKLLQGLVLLDDQVEMDKLDLDRVITKFFHIVV